VKPLWKQTRRAFKRGEQLDEAEIRPDGIDDVPPVVDHVAGVQRLQKRGIANMGGTITVDPIRKKMRKLKKLARSAKRGKWLARCAAVGLELSADPDTQKLQITAFKKAWRAARQEVEAGARNGSAASITPVTGAVDPVLSKVLLPGAPDAAKVDEAIAAIKAALGRPVPGVGGFRS